MNPASRFPKPLPPPEQLALVQRAQSGDLAATQLLVGTSLRFVYDRARYYARRSTVAIDELAHEGVFGLYDAIAHFQPDHGTRFLTYAYTWVRRAMLRCIAQYAAILTAPADILSKARNGRFERDRASAVARGVDDPDAAVAHQHGMSLDLLHACHGLRSHASMDQPLKATETSTLHDVLPSESPSHGDLVIDQDLLDRTRAVIDVFLEDLSDRHRYIFEQRVLNGQKLGTIGDALGLTRERIRQIESKLMMDFRVALVRRLSSGPRPTRRQAAHVVPDFVQ